MQSGFLVRLFLFSISIAVLSPAAAAAAGTIEGTATFWGDPGGGTQIEIAAHLNPFSAPEVTVFVPIPGSSYSIPVPDGTYYIAVLMARDNIFGEPRPEDVLAWYDADADGDRDTVTVSGGAVTGVDIDTGFVYVDIDASGGANNGSSWTDAFTGLQDGINLAVSGIEVWVAGGTYLPGASRNDSFLPKSGVRVFGGFAGGETIRQQRDWNVNPTILSGDISGDNCYHVVRAGGSNTTALLNGVTITNGQANGGGIDDHGGGVRAHGGGVTLANVTLSNNQASFYGGGVSTQNPGTVIAVNCRFLNNQSSWHGGGFYIDAAAVNPSMAVNCVFTGNTAWRGGGIAVEGQVWISGTEPVLTNLSLSNNSAGGEGGGVFVYNLTTAIPPDAPVTIENSIIWANSSPTGPQISFWGGTGRVEPVANYSIIQNGFSGTGTHILTDDPSFADAELRINLDSPAIDAGDSTALPDDFADIDEDHWTNEEIDVDLDLNWRRVNIPYIPDTGIPDYEERTVDMGAYEAFDPDLIFFDGFGSGGTDEWSNVVGGI